MIDANTEITLRKFKIYKSVYEKYLFRNFADLSCEICEIPAPADTPQERAKFKTNIPMEGWRSVACGDTWGGDFCYAWFKTSFTVPKSCTGKQLLLLPRTGASESLLYINGKPDGMFDVCEEKIANASPRLHLVQPFAENLTEGETFEILIESYAGHPAPGIRPLDTISNPNGTFYPLNTTKIFKGIKVVEYDEGVKEFLLSYTLFCQLLDVLPKDRVHYSRAVNIVRKIFEILPLNIPENSLDFYPQMLKATDILKNFICRENPEKASGNIGLIGHSHLDTAWQWPVRETLHKAARTFSNALKLMNYYPDYKFIQSSVLYIDWMKKYYPDIYEGIKKRTAEKRWEPNGGAWVEFDNNIPGGEYIIRQFLRGQRYTEENLDYKADCFWEPDTFGYSAALPQILKGCGIKYFLTTKLSWNEANKFPHDTFIWRGLDGSEVLTHFNLTHTAADVTSLFKAERQIAHRDVTDMKLAAYGYGDGGGGPSFSMQEYAERTKNIPWIPNGEFCTVSDFMKKLEITAEDLPVFSGELYLELHRGTLTQMHDIKKSNRLLEKAIRENEIVNVLSDEKDNKVLKDSIDTLLLNQFHDILPGTCIEDAHKVAIYENYAAVNNLNNQIKNKFAFDNESITLLNTLSWQRSDQFVIDNNAFIPDGCTVQKYSDINGDNKLAVSGITLLPFSAATVKRGKEKTADCPFNVEDEIVETPFAKLKFKNGTISSYISKKDGFEVVRTPEIPLNTLYFGEDMPNVWDNWDIDYDQQIKMMPVSDTVSCEIVSMGALQLRIRTVKKFGISSTVTQDIVFYSDTPRIDFDTVVDWNETHTLLKAGFDVNVLSKTARFETQFGHLSRPTHENYGTDKSQFEVCNHKWTDLSDNKFGVAILNDCKYGISVKNSDIRLTLLKGGTHPDARGDKGIHRFTYSLLVHNSCFSTESVIRPAYELNYPVKTFDGTENFKFNNLFEIDSENVIIETVKNAEDNDGIIIRLYETEGSHAICNLSSKFENYRVFETDMLENKISEISDNGSKIHLTFKPFEIKTVKYRNS